MAGASGALSELDAATGSTDATLTAFEAAGEDDDVAKGDEARGDEAAGEDEAVGLGFLLVFCCSAAFLLAFLNASMVLNSFSIKLLSCEHEQYGLSYKTESTKL